MLRDYARGVVRLQLIEPATGTLGPNKDQTALRQRVAPKDSLPNETNAYNRNDYDDIWSSVLGWGDFARYVMGAERDDAHVRGFGFSGDAARHWVFQRVLDLGWTPERFAAIDESISRCSHSRESEPTTNQSGSERNTSG